MAYEPSTSDWGTFRTIRREVTPTSSQWSWYNARVLQWTHFFGAGDQTFVFTIHGAALPIRSAREHHSILFRRNYLVVLTDAAPFTTAFGDTDAIALDFPTQDIPGVPQDPPMVLVPEGRLTPLSDATRSILEHEFVHVNQFLMASSPRLPNGTSANEALHFFAETISAEYEAHVLQLTMWPSMYPDHDRFSLPQWCAFRSYTAALEPLVRHLLFSRMAPASIRLVFAALATEVEELLKAAECDLSLVPVLQTAHRDYLALTLRLLLETDPSVQAAPGYATFRASLQGNVPVSRRRVLRPDRYPVPRRFF